ncbi:hypothetical protein JTB14_025233 [Gonioctena quinquepunctata]|nr:hypothetical protein JTB14_025233 [Gonioctena quinquepunctata]
MADEDHMEDKYFNYLSASECKGNIGQTYSPQKRKEEQRNTEHKIPIKPGRKKIARELNIPIIDENQDYSYMGKNTTGEGSKTAHQTSCT